MCRGHSDHGIHLTVTGSSMHIRLTHYELKTISTSEKYNTHHCLCTLHSDTTYDLFICCSLDKALSNSDYIALIHIWSKKCIFITYDYIMLPLMHIKISSKYVLCDWCCNYHAICFTMLQRAYNTAICWQLYILVQASEYGYIKCKRTSTDVPLHIFNLDKQH